MGVWVLGSIEVWEIKRAVPKKTSFDTVETQPEAVQKMFGPASPQSPPHSHTPNPQCLSSIRFS